jgi:DNA-binding XRE family transcriptional regulator
MITPQGAALCEYLNKLRDAQPVRVTNTQLATRLGLSRENIGAVFNGRHTPQWQTTRQLILYFGGDMTHAMALKAGAPDVVEHDVVKINHESELRIIEETCRILKSHGMSAEMLKRIHEFADEHIR